jgi:hypothetical protein
MTSPIARNLVTSLYQVAGILAVLDTLERVDEADRAAITPLIEQVIPAEFIAFGAERYQREILRHTDALLQRTGTGELIIVGPPEMAVLRALVSLRHRRPVRFVVTASISATDFERMQRNVPLNVNAAFSLPGGSLPTVRISDTVAAIGVAADATGNMVLIDRKAPGLINQMARWRENGAAHLLQPDLGRPTFARTPVLAAASRTLFYRSPQGAEQPLPAPVPENTWPVET